jgi:hypothetical protein
VKEISEDVQRLLKTCVDHFDKEDSAVRERQIRKYKKLKYYWDGYQRIWWSDVAHDWRVFDITDNNDQSSGDASFYDKPVNIFRAYLESIIAALSVNIPSINCAPDDADNALDISTAKAGDKISELIYKHNDVTLLWLHALYIFCTEGMIACYSYPKEDEKYGTYDELKYEDEEVTNQVKVCPNCGAPIQDETLANEQENKFQPDDSDVPADNLIENKGIMCQQCLIAVEPELKDEKLIVPKLVGITTKPKTRICLEVHGGLFVKVASYAQNQCGTPYLFYCYETHYANVFEKYPKMREKMKGDSNSGPNTGPYDTYGQWGRLSTQYFGETPTNNVTVRNCWLRPAAFNVLSEEDAAILKKKYPDGAKVVCINDNFADACNESLDDCWTLSHNPLADYINHDPLGSLLTSVQEIFNDLISLTLQTIEHGITQTFVDPGVVNFEQYRQTETTPGMLYPAKPQSGKSLNDAFFETKTAQLSGEVLPFGEKVNEMGQLVSGALPSLFGGASPNSSKTAAQYAMSRAQALQRLQTTWKMLTIWWKTIFGKVIPAYIKEVKDDERIVQKDKSGNFINVFIRKAELQGKIGEIELEASDQLPLTWAQKKDVIMQLLQASNPEVMAALMSPENIPLLQSAIGLDDFIIPGQDDRQKQYEEIKILLESAPIKIPPDPQAVQQAMMSGQPAPQDQEQPSVEVEPLVDNHQIEAEVCKTFLVSDAGRMAKIENPNGYKNILLHMQQHMNMQRAFSLSAQPTPPGQSGGQQQQNAPIAQKVSNGPGSEPGQ